MAVSAFFHGFPWSLTGMNVSDLELYFGSFLSPLAEHDAQQHLLTVANVELRLTTIFHSHFWLILYLMS